MLARLSIRTKVLGLVGVLTALCIAMTLYLVFEAKRVDDRYSQLVDREMTLALEVEKARGAIAQLAWQINGVLVLPDATELPTRLRSMQAVETRIEQSLTGADRVASAGQRAELSRTRTALTRMKEVAARIFPLKERGEHAAALALWRADGRPVALATYDELGQTADRIAASVAERSAGLTAENNSRITFILGLLAVVVAVSLGGGVMVAVAGITRPIQHLSERMTSLASGDLAADVPGLATGNEIGGMAAAVLVFRENMIKARDQQAVIERERIAKDRRQAAMDRHTQDFGTSIGGVMRELVNSAESMQAAAGDMAQAVATTRENATRTATGAEQASSNLSTVAASVEEMSASISEISAQVTHANTAARQAVERARETDAKVGSLAEAADRVGQVVEMISAIANQTNLLALNATIEAARAGDAGKGFAVVAGEVKTLASETAKATEEIGTQIAAIRDATAEAVEAVREVGGAIGRVSEVAIAIAAATEQQATATREIANSVQAVTGNAQTSSRDMRLVTEATGRAEAATATVHSASASVSTTAGTLQAEVAHFLQAMSSGDESERRRYERVHVQGMQARVRTPGGGEVRAEVKDISRGGLGLQCELRLSAGAPVEVVLPGSSQVLQARTVRSDGRFLALTFRQDEATLQRVDQLLATVTGSRTAQAA